MLINSLPLGELVVKLDNGADAARAEAAIRDVYPEAFIQNHQSHSARHGIQKDVDMFRNLSYLFPLMAFAVAALIVLITITRMLENQRMQMGTLKALGYHDGQMLRHYMSYAFYPSLVGSLLGLFVGRETLPYILWSLEEARFTMVFASTVEPASFVIACAVTFVFSWMITRLLTAKVKNIDMVEALKNVE